MTKVQKPRTRNMRSMGSTPSDIEPLAGFFSRFSPEAGGKAIGGSVSATPLPSGYRLVRSAVFHAFGRMKAESIPIRLRRPLGASPFPSRITDLLYTWDKRGSSDGFLTVLPRKGTPRGNPSFPGFGQRSLHSFGRWGEIMETLRLERYRGVGLIRFHRPEVRNAVNLRMMDELETVLREWRQDDAVRTVLLAGDRHAFVSGGDLSELHRLTREEEIYPVMARMGRLLLELQDLGKPTIAAVEGAAVGGGCEIAVSCDFRLASDRARFGFVQVRLGITSGWGGGTRLLSLLKRSDALYLLLTGEVIDSETALRIGLVDRVFPGGE